jgi:hypothetical protein
LHCTIPAELKGGLVENETKTCLFSAKPGCRGGSPVKFACGRPVDIVEMKDGSLIVSDDRVGAIYRITYEQ